MVGELRHHHVGQKACGRDALVDHLGRYRRLDQCFTLTARPFSTHMPLNCEHARSVIELLADVFADSLKLAAAHALSILWFVTDHGSRKLRRQWCTLGLMTWLGRCGRRIGCLQLGFDSCDIGIEQIIKQTALVGAQLLAALGELVSLEDGDFMSQLLVDRFEALDFLAHGVDLGQQLHSLFGQAAQLFRCHLVEIGRGSHAADCVRAGRQQR